MLKFQQTYSLTLVFFLAKHLRALFLMPTSVLWGCCRWLTLLVLFLQLVSGTHAHKQTHGTWTLAHGWNVQNNWTVLNCVETTLCLGSSQPEEEEEAGPEMKMRRREQVEGRPDQALSLTFSNPRWGFSPSMVGEVVWIYFKLHAEYWWCCFTFVFCCLIVWPQMT